MATLAQLEEGIRRAHAAGDANGVKALGAQYVAQRAGYSSPAAYMADMSTPLAFGVSKGDWIGIGQGAKEAWDNAAMGLEHLANKAAAGGASLVNNVFGTHLTAPQSQSADRAADASAAARAQTPTSGVSRLVGNLGADAVITAPVAAIRAPAAIARALPTVAPTVAPMVARGIQGALANLAISDPRTSNAGVTAGIGAAANAFLPPVIGAGLGLASKPLAWLGQKIGAFAPDAVPAPVQRAASMVMRALSADNLTPASAASQVGNASSSGYPAMLADQGENLRRLAASVTRQPGPARAAMTTALGERMWGQNDRVVNAINTNLGPTTGVADASDALIQQARAAAAPLYDKAYSSPVVSTPELDSLLNTPAGRGALVRARTIAANERRDPAALGFSLDSDGNVVLNPAPLDALDRMDKARAAYDAAQTPQEQQAAGQELSDAKVALASQPTGGSVASKMGYTTQTLDYVKRGLDDMVEQYRDPVTGKLKLDEAGRAINGVRGQLLTEMDRLNPDYADARAAYAGPAGEKNALQLGQQMFGQPAQQIQRATANLTDSQLDQFNLGYRSAMADKSSKLVDNANRPAMLTGSPESRAALKTVFSNNPGLQSFLDSLNNEAQGVKTYQTAMTGSPTAVNLADDALMGNGSLAPDVLHGVFNIAQGQPPMGLLAKLLSRASDAYKFGAGDTGNQVRLSIADLLRSPDPSAIGAIPSLVSPSPVVQGMGIGNNFASQYPALPLMLAPSASGN